MISIPDDTLRRIDQFAERKGKTRSAFLRDLAEREIDGEEEGRTARILAALDQAGSHGGDATSFIREQRRAR